MNMSLKAIGPNGHIEDGREPVIDAVCMVFPDGTVRWAPADKNRIHNILESERDSVDDKYKDDRLLGGYIQCRVLKSDFDRLVQGSSLIALH